MVKYEVPELVRKTENWICLGWKKSISRIGSAVYSEPEVVGNPSSMVVIVVKFVPSSLIDISIIEGLLAELARFLNLNLNPCSFRGSYQ
ncbi:hypothetical protein EZS27_032351 [termite gut metagenome]|uniref:Uncharacterized protein n=1 Tax=termite gut metagenome TaxID=433724 RepID=A0A5J4Q6B5_9ZZZZ